MSKAGAKNEEATVVAIDTETENRKDGEEMNSGWMRPGDVDFVMVSPSISLLFLFNFSLWPLSVMSGWMELSFAFPHLIICQFHDRLS